MSKVKQPVERKVTAATGGAGVGAAVGAFACWLVDTTVHTPNVEGDLPAPVFGLVMAGTAAAVAWIAGYIAKHTPRGNTATIVKELVDAGVDEGLVLAAVSRATGRPDA
jgi:hypothetical protein